MRERVAIFALTACFSYSNFVFALATAPLPAPSLSCFHFVSDVSELFPHFLSFVFYANGFPPKVSTPLSPILFVRGHVYFWAGVRYVSYFIVELILSRNFACRCPGFFLIPFPNSWVLPSSFLCLLRLSLRNSPGPTLPLPCRHFHV